MKKRIYNEQTGISYTLQGDYYLPNLALPEQEDKPIGLWGQRHLKHIRTHCKTFYNKMLSEHTLYDYLLQLNDDAEEMFNRLIKQMAEREGVTEQLKADNQMEWVARMNNIRSRATEIVNQDIIYN